MPPRDRKRLIATLPQLTAYALALVRGAEQARDLVQKTALRARSAPAASPASRPPSVPGCSPFLRNAAIDSFRRERLENGEPAPPLPIPGRSAPIKAQGMGRQQWDDTVSWMVEKHKMPELDPPTRHLVLDYLAAAFPPRAQHQRGWVNPFAHR